MEALKPCPCGGSAYVRNDTDLDGAYWSWVECKKCGLRTRGKWVSHRSNTCPLHYEEVREEWNSVFTRALPPSVGREEIAPVAGWRGMDSAPKKTDGVLIYVPDWGCEVVERTSEETPWIIAGEIYLDGEPTLWTPIPSPTEQPDTSPAEPASCRDIEKQTGVSKATVSRFMNGGHDINLSTAKKLLPALTTCPCCEKPQQPDPVKAAALERAQGVIDGIELAISKLNTWKIAAPFHDTGRDDDWRFRAKLARKETHTSVLCDLRLLCDDAEDALRALTGEAG